MWTRQALRMIGPWAVATEWGQVYRTTHQEYIDKQIAGSDSELLLKTEMKRNDAIDQLLFGTAGMLRNTIYGNDVNDALAEQSVALTAEKRQVRSQAMEARIGATAAARASGSNPFAAREFEITEQRRQQRNEARLLLEHSSNVAARDRDLEIANANESYNSKVNNWGFLSDLQPASITKSNAELAMARNSRISGAIKAQGDAKKLNDANDAAIAAAQNISEANARRANAYEQQMFAAGMTGTLESSQIMLGNPGGPLNPIAAAAHTSRVDTENRMRDLMKDRNYAQVLQSQQTGLNELDIQEKSVWANMGVGIANVASDAFGYADPRFEDPRTALNAIGSERTALQSDAPSDAISADMKALADALWALVAKFPGVAY